MRKFKFSQACSLAFIAARISEGITNSSESTSFPILARTDGITLPCSISFFSLSLFVCEYSLFGFLGENRCANRSESKLLTLLSIHPRALTCHSQFFLSLLYYCTHLKSYNVTKRQLFFVSILRSLIDKKRSCAVQCTTSE